MDPVCIFKSPSQPHTKRHNFILCCTYISLWWDIYIPIHWYFCNWRNYLLPILNFVFTICGYLRGSGALQWSNLAYLAAHLSSHPNICTCTCKIRKQYDKNFLSSNLKYETNIFVFILRGTWRGGGGGAQNHSCSPYEVISGNYLPQFLWNVDQKWN